MISYKILEHGRQLFILYGVGKSSSRQTPRQSPHGSKTRGQKYVFQQKDKIRQKIILILLGSHYYRVYIFCFILRLDVFVGHGFLGQLYLAVYSETASASEPGFLSGLLQLRVAREANKFKRSLRR